MLQGPPRRGGVWIKICPSWKEILRISSKRQILEALELEAPVKLQEKNPNGGLLEGKGFQRQDGVSHMAAGRINQVSGHIETGRINRAIATSLRNKQYALPRCALIRPPEDQRADAPSAVLLQACVGEGPPLPWSIHVCKAVDSACRM